ncbi:hypothetical protein [Saccharopolyspora hattusasensis]|uniref:hypothetical protein n=1 Tax=Saccharopolyspora hattusasensis TaxID=1128679 RepID=UPI003D974F48
MHYFRTHPEHGRDRLARMRALGRHPGTAGRPGQGSSPARPRRPAPAARRHPRRLHGPDRGAARAVALAQRPGAPKRDPVLLRELCAFAARPRRRVGRLRRDERPRMAVPAPVGPRRLGCRGDAGARGAARPAARPARHRRHRPRRGRLRGAAGQALRRAGSPHCEMDGSWEYLVPPQRQCRS